MSVFYVLEPEQIKGEISDQPGRSFSGFLISVDSYFSKIVDGLPRRVPMRGFSSGLAIPFKKREKAGRVMIDYLTVFCR
jgi:hypothetical protein